MRAAASPTVVFLSDFGTADDSVAICKGVMLGIAPDVRIVDLTHDVPPYSVRDGARFLAGAAPYYPAGTVFVAVDDVDGHVSRQLALSGGRQQIREATVAAVFALTLERLRETHGKDS